MNGSSWIAALALESLAGVAIAQDPSAILMSHTPPSAPFPSQTRQNAVDAQIYVWIAPGAFIVGCSPGDNECKAEEKPPHEVQLTKGYRIGQTVVTVGAWKRYRSATGAPALPTMDPHRSTMGICGKGRTCGIPLRQPRGYRMVCR